MTELIMLGTGHAMVTKCYNTCFALRNEMGTVLIDAGGGNGILPQMERADIKWDSLRAMFLTHAHTDHILGGIWVIRKINSLIKQGKYQRHFMIYGLQEGLHFLKNSCQFLLTDSISDRIHFTAVTNDDTFSASDIHFKVFDIFSTKMPQIGFRADFTTNSDKLSKRISLACLGDEPYNDKCFKYVNEVNWLCSEAFCLHKDKDVFRPYEKHHSTALDAGKIAQKLNVEHLIMYHTEDSDLQNRRENYTKEAALSFNGMIYVPDDLETIPLI